MMPFIVRNAGPNPSKTQMTTYFSFKMSGEDWWRLKEIMDAARAEGVPCSKADVMRWGLQCLFEMFDAAKRGEATVVLAYANGPGRSMREEEIINEMPRMPKDQ